MTVLDTSGSVGELLRGWRRRRRLSQLELSSTAEVSSRHLSFIETGRSAPSRSMILRLGRELDVPLREQNALLVAGGFAPVFPQAPPGQPPAAVHHALETVLSALAPYPALVVDRHWELVSANGAVELLLTGASPRLLEPPVNVLRLSLHPDGLAPRIRNLGQWREHVLARLAHQADVTADPVLADLLVELDGYPGSVAGAGESGAGGVPLVVPLVVDTPIGVLDLISTTTVFGTALDVTVAELAIEAFHPGDSATADRLRRAAGG